MVQLERLAQQLQAAQKDLEAARSAEASARSKAAAEAKQRTTHKAEADAAAANMRSEHAAELARLAGNRKKLEVHISRMRGTPFTNPFQSSLYPSQGVSSGMCIGRYLVAHWGTHHNQTLGQSVVFSQCTCTRHLILWHHHCARRNCLLYPQQCWK